jgi:hypothetical protein
MKLSDLIGKTITSAKIKRLNGYDDTGFLELKFSDETQTTIVSEYGGYTGESYDEYPTQIVLSTYYDNRLVDIEEKE